MHPPEDRIRKVPDMSRYQKGKEKGSRLRRVVCTCLYNTHAKILEPGAYFFHASLVLRFAKLQFQLHLSSDSRLRLALGQLQSGQLAEKFAGWQR